MYLIRGILLIALLFSTYSMGNTKELSDFLPQESDGWTAEGEDQWYDPSNLYDYINGGAELYISYGFKSVVSRYYKRNDQPSIRIEIFDMNQSKNAYGVYSISKESYENEYGQGSQYIEGSLIFWKDRYFISLMADYETTESKVALKKMAEFIDKAIKTIGDIPPVTNILPREKLDTNSIIYFYHHAWQNTYYYLTGDNVFNLDSNNNAVLAKYNFDEDYAYVLLIEYSSYEKATNGYNNFVIDFFVEPPLDPIVQLEDKKWITCFNESMYVVCIFSSKTQKNIELLKEIIYQSL